jgi:hypothetical protein
LLEAFSKCVIKKVISPFQWEVGPPWAPRKLSQTFQPQFYNYYDYQAAWYDAFYFQNDSVIPGPKGLKKKKEFALGG